MNTVKIYSEAIGRTVMTEGLPESPAEDAARKQMLFNWLQSTPTQELFESLKTSADSLIEQAINLAITYHTHKTHEQILSCLVRAHELKNVIKQQTKQYA